MCYPDSPQTTPPPPEVARSGLSTNRSTLRTAAQHVYGSASSIDARFQGQRPQSPIESTANMFQRMTTDPPAGVSASPIADNVMTWYILPFSLSSKPPYSRTQSISVFTLLSKFLAPIHHNKNRRSPQLIPPTRNAVIIGPSDTPFEDGTFRLIMHFDEQYPNKPPGVKFISQMFHPNVYNTGELCLDILQNRWSPTYDVAAILTSVQRYISCLEEILYFRIRC